MDGARVDKAGRAWGLGGSPIVCIHIAMFLRQEERKHGEFE